MKKIRVYTENHGEAKYWQNHLIHPIRAYWGDGTPEWDKWEKDLSRKGFYLNFKNQIAKIVPKIMDEK